MPELSPLEGWTEYAALTNLSTTYDRGTIDGTPARGWQWCYSIDQEVEDGLHEWEMSFRVLRSDGETVVFESTLVLPILVTPGGGGFPAIWSIQNARIEQVYPETPATWQNESDQPLVLPLNDGDLPVQCEVYSAHYLVPLPARAIFDVTFHNVGTPDLRFAPVLTSVLSSRARKRMLLDPVSADQYLPRIENEMLVVRTQAYDGMVGPRTGLALSYADGTATATAGSAVIGYATYEAPGELRLEGVPTTGTVYLFLVPDEETEGRVKLAYGTEAPAGAAWCLGRVKSNRLQRCSGVLVADGVDEVAIDRREDGLIVLRYDAGSEEDLVAISRDRGVTWETD